VNILITGKTGYISGRLNQALTAGGHRCAAVSLRNGLSALENLGKYDTVIHCAALVHSKTDDPGKYYEINAELTGSLAERAKNEGVRRFVFMSTLAVYGIADSLRGVAVIDGHTPENPVTPYGGSKLMAEERLRGLAGDHFQVYILRLPMVYGAGAPGNYARLRRLVQLTPVFPKVSNRRSMIAIENLRQYVTALLKNSGQTEAKGTEYVHILCPQDPVPVCTSDLAAGIAAGMGKKIYLSPLLGRLVLFFPIGPIRKMFGSLVYTDNP